MEENIESQEAQNIPEEVASSSEDTVTLTKEQAEKLQNIANASSQNFERLKKTEETARTLKTQNEELKRKLETSGEAQTFDPDKLRSEIEEKVSLRMGGYSAEHISEIEKFAKGAGLSLSEAANHPLIKKGIEGLRSEEKSSAQTPSPSNRIKIFNGKPESEVFKSGTASEKQAAWDAKLRGGVKTNE